MSNAATVALVELVITNLWGKMVGWQERAGWRAAGFDAEDTVQNASSAMFRNAVAGKYDGKTEVELGKILAGLVRQAGYNGMQAERLRSASSLEVEVACEPSDLNAADARDFLQVAFEDDMWIAEGLMTGVSLNDLGKKNAAGIGRAAVSKRFRAVLQRAIGRGILVVGLADC